MMATVRNTARSGVATVEGTPLRPAGGQDRGGQEGTRKAPPSPAPVHTARHGPARTRRGRTDRAQQSALTRKCSSWRQEQTLGRLWAVRRSGRPRTSENYEGHRRWSGAHGVFRVLVQRGGADESACKPDSVPGHLTAHRSATIHLGLPSPAGSCGPPAGSDGPPSNACAADRFAPADLLTLLRVGFTEPPRSPGVLVVSYTTVSPLPPARRGRRSVLCGTVPRVAPGCR